MNVLRVCVNCLTKRKEMEYKNLYYLVVKGVFRKQLKNKLVWLENGLILRNHIKKG